jgi:tetratricopeptide (TPR) repeat protein
MAAYINKGISLSNLGLMEESIKVYEFAWNINPSNPVLYFNKGNTYKKLG